MPRFEDTRILPYTPEQLFDLVLNVADYPLFLPWCKAAHIYEVQQQAFMADVVVGYKAFQETFVSHVHHRSPTEIEVKYQDGPFKYLINKWSFQQARGGGQLDFTVDFEFKSRLLEAAIRPVFPRAVGKMIAAFEQRAAVIYPKPLKYKS